MLCFDGDGAGPAPRIGRSTLPCRCSAGKSLKFATLPEATIPDDLCVPVAARRLVELMAVRARSPTCLVRARPKPIRPRHAGAPRCAGGAAWRGHDDDRRRDGAQILPAGFGARLRNLLAPAGAPPRNAQAGGRQWGERNWAAAAVGGDRKPRARRFGPAGRRRGLHSGTPYVVASPQMATSAVHRGQRAVLPLREALILQTAINHPWLLQTTWRTCPGSSSGIRRWKAQSSRLIDTRATTGGHDGAAMRAELIRRGFADPISRTEKAITTASVWGAAPEAGPQDALMPGRSSSP